MILLKEAELIRSKAKKTMTEFATVLGKPAEDYCNMKSRCIKKKWLVVGDKFSMEIARKFPKQTKSVIGAERFMFIKSLLS